MALTQARLEKFVRVRNKSEFSNNLQFQLDANSCGFSVDELGKVTKHPDGAYYWETPFGMLVECYGRLSLSDTPYDKEYVLGQAFRQARAAFNGELPA